MCISKLAPAVREILNAESTTGMVGCVTGWIPLTGVDTLHIIWAVRALSGNISVVPVIQYADVRTDRPGDWATVGATALTQEGDAIKVVDLTGTPGANEEHFFFRVGLQYTEDTGAGHADCRLILSYKCMGEVVASRTLNLDNATSTTKYVPITGVLPTVGRTHVNAAFLLTGGSNVEFTLAYRLLEKDDEEGGSWNTIGTLHNPTSDDYDEWILTDQAVSFGTNMYFQLGVAYNSGAASDGYGVLTVLAAARG